MFPFHFLKNWPARLRQCFNECSSVWLTKDHGLAIVGVSDSSLIQLFCARFAGFHLFADIKTVYVQCSIQYIQYYYL